MAQIKVICYECGGRHKATPEKFPKCLQEVRMETNPKNPNEKISRLVVVGFICVKCARKAHLQRMKTDARVALALEQTIIITKHHLREYFKLKQQGPITVVQNKGE